MSSPFGGIKGGGGGDLFGSSQGASQGRGLFGRVPSQRPAPAANAGASLFGTIAAPSKVPAQIKSSPPSLQKTPKGPIFRNPSELVTLEFGPEKVKFLIHKEFACHYSPVLKAAFNSEFLEGQTKVYTLDEPIEDTGRLFTHWIYTQQLSIIGFEHWNSKNTDMALVQLWVLADKLLIPQLQNQAIRELHRAQMGPLDVGDPRIPFSTINYLYENTPRGSPLRKYIINMCALYVDEQYYLTNSSEFPKEMLLELVVAFAETVDMDDVKERFTLDSDWTQFEVAEEAAK
ncbi:hypothetical protein LSUE1_G005518 [Lachnellula suecica]|uniref:BTB domain-containing protein n=1 Tax=Lachnellula suecica TaxID=602035 RepID=A0A8T9BZS6_9HELO|nr:hypothetical protein LSUE1_G005518 [Lachnellula suecica]